MGGLLSGLALSIGTDLAFHVVVALNAASYGLAFWLLLAVPAARATPPETGPGEPAPSGGWLRVLSDGPYLILAVTQLGYSMSMMVLNYALPIYAVEVLELPGWVTGAIFTINTVMVGLGQGLVVRAMTGRVRYRMLMAMQLVFAAS